MDRRSFRWSAAILAAAACLSSCQQQDSAPEPEAPATVGSWRLTAPMLASRAAHSLTMLRSGKVLAAGGDRTWSVAGGESLAAAELYDPTTETWTATGSMGTPRSFHIAVLLRDGTVLVAGGCDGYVGRDCVPLATAEIYDPELGTWAPTGSMAHARGRAGTADHAAVLPDGKVLVVGAVSGPAPFVFGSSSEVYDPASRSWAEVGDAVEPGDGHAVVALADGRVLAVGSFGDGMVGSAVAQIYDPSTAAWRATAPFHRPVLTNTLTRLGDGRVLSFGGCEVAQGFPCGTPMDPTAWLFDPASGAETWSPTAPIVYPRIWASAVLLPSGRVLVAGGNSQIFTLFDYDLYAAPAGEIYDPQRDTWTPTPVMPHYVNVASAMVVLPSGEVLFTGGILWDGVEGTNDHILPISAAQMFRE